MAPANRDLTRPAESSRTMVLGIVLGLLLPASLQVAAQDLTSMTSELGLTAFKHSLLRQVNEYASMVTEEAQSRSRNAPANSRRESLTLIERRINRAVGKGSVACSTIGGFDDAPACVSGDDVIAAPRREQ